MYTELQTCTRFSRQKRLFVYMAPLGNRRIDVKTDARDNDMKSPEHSHSRESQDFFRCLLTTRG
jgi:hypothetical protein